MRNVLTDRPSTPNNSVESEGKSRQDLIELNRHRLAKSLIKEACNFQEKKANQQTQNTARNKHHSFPQPYSKGNSQRSWERIGQGAIQGTKWTVFSVVAIAIGVMVLYEPSPSTKQEQATNTNNSPSSLDLPTSVSPQETLPLPDTVLPQLSPQKEELGTQSLTVNPYQKSLDKPLTISPSIDKIPSPKPELSSEPSLSDSNPVIPPNLAPILPPVEPPCAGSSTHQESSSVVTDNQVITNKNFPSVEVKNYFKKGWQPPSGLKQTLEYSMSINADGTIQRIRPLSNAAGENINSTNLPLPGSPFVSPREGGGNTNIYVAFNPNGTVKTALE